MDNLICKRCNQEFKGVLHHVFVCGCAEHLKFWKLFKKEEDDDKDSV
jgi:hypothetical protein